MKTGTTAQIKFDEETRLGNQIYLPGVYNSFNADDALPGEPEFTLYCKTGPSFCGNSFAAVLHRWREYCAEVEVTEPEEIERLG